MGKKGGNRMQRSKSQLNAIYYAHRDSIEKFGIDFKRVTRPFGTEFIHSD